KTADREAAFLLARGIISQSDLAVFVTKSGTTETVTHLPKETAAAWIVKLLGKQAEAEQINVAEAAKFLDDSEVSADHKKLVYYAAQTGIAAVHDGYFSPDRLVTRAELAQMLYNALSPQHTPAPSPTPSASPAASTAPPLQSDRPTAGFHGTVESVFDTGSELCIQADVNGNSVIYRFAVSAVVTIDGLHRSVAHLRTGMTFYAVSSGGNVILSLVARTATGSQTTPAPSPAAPPPASAENEGYVTQIFTTPVNALAIRTHRLRMTGELNTEESQYSLSASCVIKRGNQTVPFGSIKIDDIVVFSHIGNIITSIELFEKDREIKGTLLDKKFFPLTGTPVLTIMGDDGRVYEMRATSETKFTRNSQSAVWRSLRIGDLIEARCEYDMLAELSAAGLRSVVTGVLEAMHITRNSVTVVIKLSDNTEAVYRVDAESVDVYQMRVGKETRLYLDSLEVYNQYTFN
ncbi:MAG: hypothetical protein FWE82_10040, partial [Defluviitaleaceae bacterium]|nr:hypothetical protein [Defluviitaleaceae bacterium]